MNKEMLRSIGFGKEVDMVENGVCPTCTEPIDWSQFRDELSKKEYRISGMCQKCQDEVFGK